MSERVPCLVVRDAIVLEEAIDTGLTVTSGVESTVILDAIRLTLAQSEKNGNTEIPAEYQVRDTPRRVLNLMRSAVSTHHAQRGIRR